MLPVQDGQRPTSAMNMGLLRHHLHGAFADYAKAPADIAFVLPDDVGFEEGSMFEPRGGRDARHVEKACITPGGFCAGVRLRACRAGWRSNWRRVCGASKVIAVDINPYRLDMWPRKLGAIAGSTGGRKARRRESGMTSSRGRRGRRA